MKKSCAQDVTNEISSSQIKTFIDNRSALQTRSLCFVGGTSQRNPFATKVLPPELADETSLVFVSTGAQLSLALKNKVPLIIAGAALAEKEHSLWQLASSAQAVGALFSTHNIQMAMAEILPLFDQKKSRFSPLGQIHSSACLHPTAKMGRDITICAYAVIGEDVHLGDGTIVGPHCIIESHARLGKNTLLHGSVFIGASCVLGDNCEIHPHTTIGSDGFGFAPTKLGAQKIPQLGNVVIGDHVEIGAGCAIDRATLTSTTIGPGTKIDNLVHIAHNCQIGGNGMIAAGFMVAGSAKIGSGFMTGGNSVVTSHVTITDNVVLAGRSTVTNDITKPGQYGGYPLQPLRTALRTIANVTKLTSMRKQLHQIMKHLNLETNPEDETTQ